MTPQEIAHEMDKHFTIGGGSEVFAHAATLIRNQADELSGLRGRLAASEAECGITASPEQSLSQRFDAVINHLKQVANDVVGDARQLYDMEMHDDKVTLVRNFNGTIDDLQEKIRGYKTALSDARELVDFRATKSRFEPSWQVELEALINKLRSSLSAAGITSAASRGG